MGIKRLRGASSWETEKCMEAPIGKRKSAWRLQFGNGRVCVEATSVTRKRIHLVSQEEVEKYLRRLIGYNKLEKKMEEKLMFRRKREA